MIKKMLIAVVFFWLGVATINNFEVVKEEYGYLSRGRKPKVDKALEGAFKRLDSIYESKGIRINYRKVKEIKVLDSVVISGVLVGPGYEGLYIPKDRTVFVNLVHPYELFNGHYDNKLLLVLAHEIAHSQGFGHELDYCSIMFPNSRYSLYLLMNYEVEELVSEIYLK